MTIIMMIVIIMTVTIIIRAPLASGSLRGACKRPSAATTAAADKNGSHDANNNIDK